MSELSDLRAERGLTMHTKGPWDVLDRAILSENLNTYGNWIVCEMPDRDNIREDMENARLISAAPDLLAALKGLVEDDLFSCEYFDMAKRAIARAEGRE